MSLTISCIDTKFVVCLIVAFCMTFGVSDTSYAQNQSNAQIAPNATPGHRQIPSAARLGQMQARQANVVAIDGTDWMLSPGATVRNERNLLTNITALYSVTTVRYTVNAQGMVDRVWLLDEQENTYSALENAGVEQPSFLRRLISDVFNSLF